MVESNNSVNTQKNGIYSASDILTDDNSAYKLSQNDSICAHLYQLGFLNGTFHDVELELTLKDGALKTFRLHRIVLSQSRFFMDRFMNSNIVDDGTDNPKDERTKVDINLSDYYGLLSEEAIAYNIAFMYNQFPLKLINNKNAFDVFIASAILKVEQLCEKSYSCVTVNNEDLNTVDIKTMVDRIQTILKYYCENEDKELPELVNHYINYGKDLLIERTNNEIKKHSLVDNNEVVEKFYYLVELPFDWFKEVLENTKLNITHMERFKLSKIIINKRNQVRNITNKGESVIMAFGSSSTLSTNNKSSSKINILPAGESKKSETKKPNY